LLFSNYILPAAQFSHKKILPAAPFFTYKNLVCGAFDSSVFFSLPIHWYRKQFDFKYSVITTTLFVKIINKESFKCQILCQIGPREIKIAQHQFNFKTVHKKQWRSSRVTEITTARLVFIRLRFHAFSSRLLLGPWHSNVPEPTIHSFLTMIAFIITLGEIM